MTQTERLLNQIASMQDTILKQKDEIDKLYKDIHEFIDEYIQGQKRKYYPCSIYDNEDIGD